MSRLLAIVASLAASCSVDAQVRPVTEAMKQSCLAAVEQLVDTHDVASEAKTRAVSAVELHCAFSKEVLERAVRLAAGADVAGAGCTLVRDNTVTFIPGESCEARNARLAMASARGGAMAPASAAVGSAIEQRIYAALARGELLLPPGESAWDLLRSPAATALSPGQRLALQQEFDAQAKTCFGEALNARPERIERARICLEAITLVNPGWQHLDRERRRLAVAIDAVGVTTHGVDAVLAGKVGSSPPLPVVAPMQAPGNSPAAMVPYAVTPATDATATRPAAPLAQDRISDLQAAIQARLGAVQPARTEPVQSTQAGFSDVTAAASPTVGVIPGPETAYQPPVAMQQAVAAPAPTGPVATPVANLESSSTQSPAPVAGRMLSSAAVPMRKLALVIGNSQYRDEQWGVLPNTVNDVRLISQALRSIGFAVSENIDLSRDDMITAYSDFEAAANGAEIALVYYAGHAVQVAGENILMPVDAKVGALTAMRDRGLNADSFRDAMSGANLRMLVLDSCRDNPFSSRSGNQFLVTRGGGGSGGLASMRANDGRGRKGSVVLFSTAAGEQALDGEGSNSPFAEAFARHVIVPGVPLQDFIIDVQKQVMQSTQNLQQPYSDSSLLEKNIFLAGEY